MSDLREEVKKNEITNDKKVVETREAIQERELVMDQLQALQTQNIIVIGENKKLFT
jgi:hypothetical protein